MKCLALDTTTDICSLAATDGPELLGEHNFAHRMDLSRRLMPNIVQLVKDCGLEMKGLEAVGVSLGPGSFTGLRIGVVTAKTLAQALAIPIAGIVSLDLLAKQFDYLPDSLVCPLIKVRRGEVYHAFYQTGGDSIRRLSEYVAGGVDQVVEDVRGLGEEPVIFCGDGLGENLPALRDRLGGRVIPAPPWLSFPKASVLARLVLEKISAGESADALSLLPFYIRRSAPEMRIESM